MSEDMNVSESIKPKKTVYQLSKYKSIKIKTKDVKHLDKIFEMNKTMEILRSQEDKIRLSRKRIKVVNKLSLKTLNTLFKNMSENDIHFYDILVYNCKVKLKPKEYIARFWSTVADNKPHLKMNGFGGNIVTIEKTYIYENDEDRRYEYYAVLKELHGWVPFHFIDKIVEKSNDTTHRKVETEKRFGVVTVI